LIIHKELENEMEKKLNLFGILGIVVLVAFSTMGFVRYQRAPRVASGPAAPALACLPEAFGSEFRSPHVWNGILIPPVDVTNSLQDHVNACLPAGSGAASQPFQGIPVTGALPVFQTPPYSDFIPSRAVTGFQTPPMSDFVPSTAVTGFRTPPMSNLVASTAVAGFQTPPMSDFVPSIAVTGFRTPPMSDFVPSIVKTGLSGYSQHNEHRSAGSLAGFAENLRLYELRYTAR
jgi:hypothetical protein